MFCPKFYSKVTKRLYLRYSKLIDLDRESRLVDLAPFVFEFQWVAFLQLCPFGLNRGLQLTFRDIASNITLAFIKSEVSNNFFLFFNIICRCLRSYFILFFLLLLLYNFRFVFKVVFFHSISLDLSLLFYDGLKTEPVAESLVDDRA